jgi:hypothetical protein
VGKASLLYQKKKPLPGGFFTGYFPRRISNRICTLQTENVITTFIKEKVFGGDIKAHHSPPRMESRDSIVRKRLKSKEEKSFDFRGK